ncbi:PREDICTED: inorganic pyrophosphatase isoform X3 [Rhagoletis zephyria]|uniref:inorganic pyrophosphatase isoform X1 n=1 Tax=Rhagoletis zephyria TaxID=28612 RepID=UPI0008113E16|nr:PREDICTED: inorganic pyrophosphatase isoform X1 [Rhagoletis zephyria]XP_017475517.1 PREDICTED: inorganic pyrophosphatase isoform X2 [Rhagoletis zephyria]XP_017475518.1 PREDICTED: inorganic pyrophosphatase isoform X3 [Rhagoletis zephyria]
MPSCSSTFTKFLLIGRSAHVLGRLTLTSASLKFAAIENTNRLYNFQKRLISQSAKYLQISNANIRKQLKGYKMTEYTIVEKGAPNSTNYSIYLKNQTGAIVSPLHDIPLYADEKKTVLNMVVEIPRWTNAKMEISTNTPLNPIKQDVKKGKLRFVANCFPHKGYIWNYGAFPQTWENPGHIEPSTGCKGDNDPIDVLEIGYRVANRGEVIQVKVLGTVALIDEGETDWKIITIDVNDPLAEKMNDIGDVDKYFPGLLRATVEWFKIYKIPDGKPENKFAFNGDAKCAAFANNIIEETNKFWKGLITKELEGGEISITNTTNADTPGFIKNEEAEQILASAADGGEPEELSDTVDRWHFVHLK